MDTINRATLRLERALDRLEQVADGVLERMGDPALARQELKAILDDRSDLARRLDDVLEQEAALQTLTDEISTVLDSVINDIHITLKQEKPG